MLLIFLIWARKISRNLFVASNKLPRERKTNLHIFREICVPIKERFIHVRGIENPQNDGCLHRVREICRNRRGKTYFLVLRRARERRKSAFSVPFQYFGHIAEEERFGKAARRTETRSRGWDGNDGRRQSFFFSPRIRSIERRPPSSAKNPASTNLPEKPRTHRRRCEKVPTKPFPDPVYFTRECAIASLLSIDIPRFIILYREKKKLRKRENLFDRK